MTDQNVPTVRTWTAAVTGSVTLWNALVATLDAAMEDFRAGKMGTYLPYGTQLPTTPVLYRAIAKLDLVLRDSNGEQLSGHVKKGDVVNVLSELASIGPNSLGRRYTERAVVNVNGANVAAGPTYLTKI